ncbi:MAG: hypothetical protein ACRDRK_24455 [Pseudonocardia sp.]
MSSYVLPACATRCSRLVAPETFHIYGEPAAELDGTLGPAFVEDPTGLASLHATFERLWAHAHHGDAARALPARTARAVRR